MVLRVGGFDAPILAARFAVRVVVFDSAYADPLGTNLAKGVRCANLQPNAIATAPPP
jgi:hypothetical protein